MIIKEMDEHAAELSTLERLLQSEPPEDVTRALQRDRSTILSALKHERDSAYHLDFFFNDSPDWALLHDLRLEMGEQTAQIDHLLIGRQLDIYVIESKYYNAEVRVSAAGEFVYYFDKKPVTVPSPVVRNRHHIDFLGSYLECNGLLPQRLGLTVRPRFHSVVLLSPTSRLTLPARPGPEISEVMRADRFLQGFNRQLREPGLGDFVAMARQVTPEGLSTLATRLAQRHLPRGIDFAARYGLKQLTADAPEECEEGCHCERCQRRITSRVARYCRDNRQLFDGRVYCFDCQKGLAFQAVQS
jgi:hypothetical protein